MPTLKLQPERSITSRMLRPVVAMCVLLCACDEAEPVQARRLVEPVVDAGAAAAQEDAAAELPGDDAGAVKQDSAVEPLPDAAAPDAGAYDAGALLPDAGPAAPDAGPALVTNRQVTQALKPVCGSCHTPITDIGYTQALPTLTLGDFCVTGSNTSTCDGMPLVVPGHPEQSYLYLALTAESPCEQHAAIKGMTSAKLATLRDWIASGAEQPR